MAFYLVRARLKPERRDELLAALERKEFVSLEPFGRALSMGLTQARIDRDGRAAWEEEDYCQPPLAQEREAVLDDYFEQIEVEIVEQDAAWRELEDLPRLFPELKS